MAKTTSTPSADTDQDDATKDSGTPADDTSAKQSDPATSSGAPASGENRFFVWVRSLDLPREPGWIGGVCSGIAARLRIDPLIVRGIVVVLAVLGAPVVLAYAIAWLLLPDRNGQIHAQELVRGHVTPAFPAIVGLTILSFLPLTQGFWYLGGIYWGQPDVVAGIARAVWMAIVLAAVVVLVVWLARRASTDDVTTGPATTDDRPETIPSTPSASAARTDTGAVITDTGSDVTTEPIRTLPNGEPVEPAPLPADASAAELAAWKKSQAEWQKQRAVWLDAQSKEAYEQRQAERRAQSAAAAAAAAERRRIQKIVRPRASGAVGALVFGLALVIGAVAAFLASTNPTTRDFTWAIGVSAATTVVGISAIIVGLARRRSGFLAFLGILGVTATLLTLIVPQGRILLAPGVETAISSTQNASVIQLGGTTSTWVSPVTSQDRSTIDIWQLGGDVYVYMLPDATVKLEAVTASGDAPYLLLEADEGQSIASATLAQTSDGENGSAGYEALIGTGAPDLTVRVWLGSGRIHILARSEDDIPFLSVYPAPENVTAFQPPMRNVDPDYIPFSTEGARR